MRILANQRFAVGRGTWIHGRSHSLTIPFWRFRISSRETKCWTDARREEECLSIRLGLSARTAASHTRSCR